MSFLITFLPRRMRACCQGNSNNKNQLDHSQSSISLRQSFRQLLSCRSSTRGSFTSSPSVSSTLSRSMEDLLGDSAAAELLDFSQHLLDIGDKQKSPLTQDKRLAPSCFHLSPLCSSADCNAKEASFSSTRSYGLKSPVKGPSSSPPTKASRLRSSIRTRTPPRRRPSSEHQIHMLDHPRSHSFHRFSVDKSYQSERSCSPLSFSEVDYDGEEGIAGLGSDSSKPAKPTTTSPITPEQRVKEEVIISQNLQLFRRLRQHRQAQQRSSSLSAMSFHTRTEIQPLSPRNMIRSKSIDLLDVAVEALVTSPVNRRTASCAVARPAANSACR